MTQEEFYMWLLNYESSFPKIPEFNSEFLKNYEIAKLFLEKFGINWLNENQQRNLNLEAASAWFGVSKFIKLDYDIPEILELLPEKIRKDLVLESSEIKFLPKLKSVGSWLNLEDSLVQSLPNLEYVGDWLDLTNSEVQFLPNLKSVGMHLDLYGSQIQSLPKLKSVGEWIAVGRDKSNYWKNYFNETGRTDLAEKVTTV